MREIQNDSRFAYLLSLAEWFAAQANVTKCERTRTDMLALMAHAHVAAIHIGQDSGVVTRDEIQNEINRVWRTLLPECREAFRAYRSSMNELSSAKLTIDALIQRCKETGKPVTVSTGEILNRHKDGR